MANGVRVSGRNVHKQAKGFTGLIERVELCGVSDPDAAMRAAHGHADAINQGRAKARAAGASRADEITDADGALVNAADFIGSLREAAQTHGPEDWNGRAARLAEAKARRRDALKAGKASMKTARKGVEARQAGAGKRAQPSAFALMATQGHLPPGLVEAGLDIDRIVGALEAGVMARSDTDAWATGGVKADGVRGAPQFFAVEGYLDRYLPWAKRLGEPDFRRGGQPGRVVLAVVIAVVCDGRSPRSLDQEAGVRNNTCMGLLCDGLREYCRIAGWREGG